MLRQPDSQNLMLQHDTKDTDLIIEVLGGSSSAIKKYSKGRLLGKGGFAKCYEIVSLETKKKYAAKVIEKVNLDKSKAKEKLTSEIKIHRSLKHQNIVGFQHCFEDAENVYILLEMCPNQTLSQLLKRRKRLTEVQAQYYLCQIINAMAYTHECKVIHRDLKLGNLFLSDRLQIKIGDFGLAAKILVDGERRKTMCGTPNYIAPQVLDSRKGHSYEVDAWAIGVISFTVLFGKPPFETNQVQATYSKIRSCSYSFPETVSISDRAKQLIAAFLQIDPSKRLTMKQALSHDFFTWSPIPSSLPISTLACPPNSNFLKQFQRSETKKEKSSIKPQKDIQQLNEPQLVYKLNNSQKNADHRYQLFSVEPKIPRASSQIGLKTQKYSSKDLLLKKQVSKPKININFILYFEQNPKFGICYLLSSNCIGMKFNDSSVLISNSNMAKMSYIELDKQLKCNSCLTFDTKQFPKQLQKKIKIISYYQRQINSKKGINQKKIIQQTTKNQKELQNQEQSNGKYVSKYYKTGKAMLFWYNNKDLQVHFQDRTKIYFPHLSQINDYISQLYQAKQFKLSSIKKQSQKIQHKVAYTYSVIQEIQSQHTQKSTTPNQQNIQQPKVIISSSLQNLTHFKSKSTLKLSSSTNRISMNLG